MFSQELLKRGDRRYGYGCSLVCRRHDDFNSQSVKHCSCHERQLSYQATDIRATILLAMRFLTIPVDFGIFLKDVGEICRGNA